jgi:hypothetical protein
MSSSENRGPAETDLKRQIADRSNAIARNPRDSRAYRDRGLFHARMHGYDQAMADLDKALSLDPTDAHAYGLRGLVWEKQGNTVRAIADFDKAIKLSPGSAHIYESHRDRATAANTLGEILQESPPPNPQIIAGGDFNLLQNPFVIFGLPPTAVAQEIIYAYEDAALDDAETPEILLRAQQILLTPRLRVDAEISGFLDVDHESAERIVKDVKSGFDLDRMAQEIDSLHALPRSNVISHFGSARALKEGDLLRLIEAQATIAIGSVCEAINEAREGAAAGKVDREVVSGALSRLETRQVKAVVEKLGFETRSLHIFVAFVERVLASRNFAEIHKLDGYIQAFIQVASAELSRQREQVVASCDSIRSDPKDEIAIERLFTSLTNCNEILRPIQAFETHMNREDASTREMYTSVRELILWLANERNEFDTASRLVKKCLVVFVHLPRAIVQLEEESETLVSLKTQQLAETLLEKIAAVCEEAQKTHRPLEQEVIRNGFGPLSKGIAKSLYDEFVIAVKITKETPISDVPWRLVRDGPRHHGEPAWAGGGRHGHACQWHSRTPGFGDHAEGETQSRRPPHHGRRGQGLRYRRSRG